MIHISNIGVFSDFEFVEFLQFNQSDKTFKKHVQKKMNDSETKTRLLEQWIIYWRSRKKLCGNYHIIILVRYELEFSKIFTELFWTFYVIKELNVLCYLPQLIKIKSISCKIYFYWFYHLWNLFGPSTNMTKHLVNIRYQVNRITYYYWWHQRENQQKVPGSSSYNIYSYRNFTMWKQKKSSDEILRLVRIEPGFWLTCYSKSNTLLSELIWHVLLRGSLNFCLCTTWLWTLMI